MKRALLAVIAAASIASAERIEHRVQRGDTAWSLARRHGLTVEELLRLNDLTSSDLRVGQILVFDAPDRGASEAEDAPVTQRGYAVYYHGRPDGQTALTAAHLSLPFGTWVRVTHQKTGRSITVMINDRGPFGRPERIIDISLEAARELGILSEGVAPVTLAVVAKR